MLLTLAPLGGKSKSEIVQALNLQWATSFDLHVLGMPPAFILSQDQTLNKKTFLSKSSKKLKKVLTLLSGFDILLMQLEKRAAMIFEN